MEQIAVPSISFRCANESCSRKSFTAVSWLAGGEVIVGKSRYMQSSKTFVAQKILKRQTSYNSFCIKRIQQTHYFLRKDENYIKKSQGSFRYANNYCRLKR